MNNKITVAAMESGDLKNRLYRLRQELDEIAKANQAYFNGKNRQGLAKKLHEARQIRTVEIRSELASLMKGGKCAYWSHEMPTLTRQGA